VAIEQRGKQTIDRVTDELVATSIIGPRSAFDLRSVAQVSAAILVGLFLIAFMLAFLPWLLSGAATAAVENLMRQVGFSKFTAQNVGDWVLVFLIGLVAIAFFVVVATALAAVANFLAGRVSFRRFRSAVVRANAEMAFDHAERIARAAGEAAADGIDALIVTPGPDLIYLAGYDPPPLERLTALIIRPGSDPVLVLPELERPRALQGPIGTLADLAPWRDGDHRTRWFARSWATAR